MAREGRRTLTPTSPVELSHSRYIHCSTQEQQTTIYRNGVNLKS